MTGQAGKGGLARVPGFPHAVGAALLLLTVPAAGWGQVAGPSFDCTRAREPLSQMICMDRGLSQTDLQLVQAYQALRATTPDAGQSALRSEAVDLQSRVQGTCGIPAVGVANWTMLQAGKACVAGLYAAQRGTWLARLSGPALEEASRPLAAHAALQTRLLDAGYLPPGTVADGVYGPGMRGAIRAWQGSTGQPVTGVLSNADGLALAEGNAPSAPAGSPKLPPAAVVTQGQPAPPQIVSAAPAPAPVSQPRVPAALSQRTASAEMPPAEAALIAAVQAARQQYRDAPNDMARGAARPMRARAICAALGSLGAQGWTGTVKELTSNGDGKGVLMLSIGENVSVGTWDNALSDILDNSLIDPVSPVFAQAAVLRRGQRVRFSGRFAASDRDCVREMSMTMSGSVSEPEFVFVFEAVAPAE